jgi:hypothetical protein
LKLTPDFSIGVEVSTTGKRISFKKMQGSRSEIEMEVPEWLKGLEKSGWCPKR